MKIRNAKKSALAAVFAAALALVSTSCMEMAQEFKVNKDMSADVVFTFGMTEQMKQMMDAAPKEEGKANDMSKESIEKTLKANENVASFEVIEKKEGEMHFVTTKMKVKDVNKGMPDIGPSEEPKDEEAKKKKDEEEPKFEKLPNGNIKFTQKLPAADPEMANNEEAAPQIKAAFADRNLTTVIKGKIVNANGKIADDKSSVTWEFPMADVMLGKVDIKTMEAEYTPID